MNLKHRIGARLSAVATLAFLATECASHHPEVMAPDATVGSCQTAPDCLKNGKDTRACAYKVRATARCRYGACWFPVDYTNPNCWCVEGDTRSCKDANGKLGMQTCVTTSPSDGGVGTDWSTVCSASTTAPPAVLHEAEVPAAPSAAPAASASAADQ
jgi:hypothetical protein